MLCHIYSKRKEILLYYILVPVSYFIVYNILFDNLLFIGIFSTSRFFCMFHLKYSSFALWFPYWTQREINYHPKAKARTQMSYLALAVTYNPI